MWLLTQDAAARRRHQSREGTIFVDTERYGAPQSGGRPAGDRAPGPALGDRRSRAWRANARGRGRRPGRPRRITIAAGGNASSFRPAVLPSAGRDRLPPRRRLRPGQSTSTAKARRGRCNGALGRLRRHVPRGAAVASLNPAVPMLWAPVSDRARARTHRPGGGVGVVIGTVTSPLGAYVGRRVGEGVARRAEDFNAGLERGAEPIVEPVNPAYPPPPGSGSRQDIADMQNSLLGILQARAQAEALE